MSPDDRPRPQLPKGNWEVLVGRQIDSVVFALMDRPPYVQLHLVFRDGFTFEIYENPGQGFSGCSHLRRKDLARVLSYIRPGADARVFYPLTPGNAKR